jgi:hypothetical protein
MIGLKKERRHFDKRTKDIVISKQKRKCGMCYFGDSYSVRSKKEYERNRMSTLILSQEYTK